MNTALSIHVGVNFVSEDHYGERRELIGCVADAEAMYAIAQAAGFCPTLLRNEEATAAAILAYLAAAADVLLPGDILMVTFSGHGGTVPDLNGDENDGRDETWCVFDRMLVDDELFEAWAAFAPGVRILVVTDSCFSGTAAKAIQTLTMRASSLPPARRARVRSLDVETSHAVYRGSRAAYDAVQRASPLGRQSTVRASILHLSACQDWEEALDGPHGLFTDALLTVWDGGAFQGSYLELNRAVYLRVAPVQEPSFSRLGPPWPAFEQQRPFTREAPIDPAQPQASVVPLPGVALERTATPPPREEAA